ncbi:MAG: hypothetical protein PQJ49_12515 [Sphaerochaetaceae bacterium]|nr:hypothetical protein [Sphaerochaetaceae bacterium]
MKTLTPVQQRIIGLNYLNKERLNLLNSIKDQYKDMEGAKVQLSTSDKSKKWTLKGDHKGESTDINGLKVHLSFQYWFEFSYSFVILHTKVCISGGSYEVRPSTAFTQYMEKSDYIGRLDNQYLKDTNDIEGCIENAEHEVNNPLNEDIFKEQLEAYKVALATTNKLKEEIHYNLRDFLPKY